MGLQFQLYLRKARSTKILSSTMKAFVAVAMAAAAQAAPEADPQLLLAQPQVYLGNAHAQTMGMVHHANGAVVPDDTLSVKAAKVDHLNAKATAYLNKPVVPLVQTVAAHQPIVQYSGLMNTLGYPYAHLIKREAEAQPEADPQLLLNTPYAAYTAGVHNIVYNGMYNYVPTVAKTVVQTPVVAKSVVAPVMNYGLNYPYTYGYSHLIKREADAEADPAVFYNNYGYGYPAYTAGVYNGYTTGLNYAYNPVYGYNNYDYNYLY